MHIYVYITNVYIYLYINIHVFRPAQDSSVWLELTSKEQLMSPGCSKHRVLSLAKMLVVNEQKIFCSHQCSPECSMINSERIYPRTRVSSWPWYYIYVYI